MGDLRLGVSAKFSGAKGDSNQSNQQGSKSPAVGGHDLTFRSVWRTREGGVVVVHQGGCWGGQIEIDKPEDTYAVELGELYGMPVTWQPDAANVNSTGQPVSGWFDGRCLHWFEDEYPDVSRQLPLSPWTRIRSASEEGGVPGPDSGMWTLVAQFFAECHGRLPYQHVAWVVAHQSGPGARELFVRSVQDHQFERARRDLAAPVVSPEEVMALRRSTMLGEDLALGENTSLSLFSPTARVARLGGGSPRSSNMTFGSFGAAASMALAESEALDLQTGSRTTGENVIHLANTGVVVNLHSPSTGTVQKSSNEGEVTRRMEL